MDTQHRLHQISYSCCRITWKFLSTTFTFFLVHMDQTFSSLSVHTSSLINDNCITKSCNFVCGTYAQWRAQYILSSHHTSILVLATFTNFVTSYSCWYKSCSKFSTLSHPIFGSSSSFKLSLSLSIFVLTPS